MRKDLIPIDVPRPPGKHPSPQSYSLPYSDPLLPIQWHLHNKSDSPFHVHINGMSSLVLAISNAGQ